MEAPPRICCLDLDTFFVSVERIIDPSLEGQQVVVGGQPDQRGVVSACSYEVRRLGVRSGMALRDAGRLAPNAVFLPSRLDTYGDYAQKVRAIAARFSPEIQIASIDEMYMSFAGCESLYREGNESGDQTIERVVREMTQTIQQELGLPSSAGIAVTRSMAKVATGLAKPAGVMMVRAGEEPLVLSPLPVRKLPGIGPVAEAKLAEIGITTCGALAATPSAELRPIFGAWAQSIKSAAQGGGAATLGAERPAFREHDVDGSVIGSISNERTFSEDEGSDEIVRGMLCSLSERVAWRARKRGVKAKTVGIKLRYSNFETLQRTKTLQVATHADEEVLQLVLGLYQQHRNPRRRMRLVGVHLSKLELESQTEIPFGGPRLESTLDAIKERYGFDSVGRAQGRLRGKNGRS